MNRTTITLPDESIKKLNELANYYHENMGEDFNNSILIRIAIDNLWRSKGLPWNQQNNS